MPNLRAKYLRGNFRRRDPPGADSPGGSVLKPSTRKAIGIAILASLVLGLVVIAVENLIVRPYHDLLIAFTFVETSCEVTAKGLEKARTELRFDQPVFDLTYTVDGRTVRSRGFDDRSANSITIPTTKVTARKILAQFRVGTAYRCWYDPAQPESVVLVKRKSFLLPLFIAVIVGLLGYALRVPEGSVVRAVVGAFGANILVVLFGYEIVEDWWRGWPNYLLLAVIGLLAAFVLAVTAYAAWRVFRKL